MSEVNELFPRFSVYKAAIEKGIPTEDAAKLALDSSLNLTRRGEWSQNLNALIPFFTPVMETSRRLANIIARPEVAVKVFGAMMATGVAETMANSMWGANNNTDGRPDYLSVDPEFRRTHLYFGNGHEQDSMAAIKLGYIASYPKYLGNLIAETALQYHSGEDGAALMQEAGRKALAATISSFSPFHGYADTPGSIGATLAPPGTKTAVDLYNNRNYFGVPIYNEQRNDKTPKSELGRSGTSDFWKGLARGLNRFGGGSEAVSGGVFDMQPEALKYLATNTLGGVGQVANLIHDAMSGTPKVASSEYAPQATYEEATRERNDMAGLLNARDKWSSSNPDKWAEQQKRYPLATRDDLLDTYKNTVETVKSLRQAHAQDLLGAQDQDAINAANAAYQAGTKEAYSSFNQMYNQAKYRSN